MSFPHMRESRFRLHVFFLLGYIGPCRFELSAKEKMMSMRTNVLVTSDHKKGRGAKAIFCAAYDGSLLDTDAAQRFNEAKGAKEALMAVIAKFSSNKHPAAEEVEKYFHEVFGSIIDLTGIHFPEKSGMSVYMAVPEELRDEDVVRKRLASYGKVKSYAYLAPVATNINRELAQPRPKELYVFAHRGGDEPDAEHLGKSYDDAMTEKMTFFNPLEYLLCTGFHTWKYKKWMDAKGGTRTSSLWSDGRLVGGYFNPGGQRLYLYDGHCDGRYPSDGPRELFLG